MFVFCMNRVSNWNCPVSQRKCRNKSRNQNNRVAVSVVSGKNRWTKLSCLPASWSFARISLGTSTFCSVTGCCMKTNWNQVVLSANVAVFVSPWFFVDNSLTLARSVAERLVQRLVCGVGMLDARFSSKFLIDNNHWSNEVSQCTVRCSCTHNINQSLFILYHICYK